MTNDFLNLYQRIEFLRNKGIRMKEIADRIGMPPSVVSALYTTVLPTYFESVKIKTEEEALNHALSQVNNISKKRLLQNIDQARQALEEFEPETGSISSSNPLGEALAESVRNSVAEIENYTGIYQSYSLSSSSDALKIEPYWIIPSENGEYIKVGRLNAYQSIQWGCAIINNHQNLYISFSETTPPQLNLVTLYLQLPFREHPNLLRGLYLALDYNRNPIARRIVLCKQTAENTIENFLEMKSGIISRDQLTPEQETYYQYTCQPGDYIKMCTVPSPQLDESDLKREKKMLEL